MVQDHPVIFMALINFHLGIPSSSPALEPYWLSFSMTTAEGQGLREAGNIS